MPWSVRIGIGLLLILGGFVLVALVFAILLFVAVIKEGRERQ